MEEERGTACGEAIAFPSETGHVSQSVWESEHHYRPPKLLTRPLRAPSLWVGPRSRVIIKSAGNLNHCGGQNHWALPLTSDCLQK